MNAWEILDAISERKRCGERYYDFFWDRSLSLGIYGLSAWESGPQQPHTEDEVYYIVRGAGMSTVRSAPSWQRPQGDAQSALAP